MDDQILIHRSANRPDRSDAIPSHPLALVFSTLFADAAAHIRRSGPMLKVATAGCRQSGLQRRRPFSVRTGEPPDLRSC
jgi:hypothetical protein